MYILNSDINDLYYRSTHYYLWYQWDYLFYGLYSTLISVIYITDPHTTTSDIYGTTSTMVYTPLWYKWFILQIHTLLPLISKGLPLLWFILNSDISDLYNIYTHYYLWYLWVYLYYGLYSTLIKMIYITDPHTTTSHSNGTTSSMVYTQLWYKWFMLQIHTLLPLISMGLPLLWFILNSDISDLYYRSTRYYLWYQWDYLFYGLYSTLMYVIYITDPHTTTSDINGTTSSMVFTQLWYKWFILQIHTLLPLISMGLPLLWFILNSDINDLYYRSTHYYLS